MIAPSIDAPRSEIDILRQCTTQLRQRIPTGWSMTVDPQPEPLGWDALIAIGTGGTEDAKFTVEVKSRLARSEVVGLAANLRSLGANEWSVGAPLLMTRYLAPSVREALRELDISYVDATGNMELVSSSPPLLIRDRGADNDPWRGPGRPRANLEGEPAARVVRALIRRDGPWTARSLVAASGASTGATYRVLDFLQKEGLVDKVDTQYRANNWANIARRWSRDYGFFRTNRTLGFIDPRGVNSFLSRLAATGPGPYAVTGSAAAARWAPYAPTRAIMLYVDPTADPAEMWGLTATDVGANVFVARAEYDVVFVDRSMSADGYSIVAPEQAAVDLLTGPGRNPSEGEELLTWMELNESQWRNG